MKAIAKLFIAAFLLFSIDSCNNLGCLKSKGTLKLTNTSINTIQQLEVDGINYGSIDPGETKEIELPVGTHTFQFVGVSGGTGCSPGSVIIQQCETSAYECSA